MLDSIIKFFKYTPKFKPGDIIARRGVEHWEKNESTWRIMELGENNYRMEYLSPPYMKGRERTQTFEIIDSIYRRLK